ncbi:hypothetical protein [Plastoroseomonas hellenica]|uniref:hypothetical protein n=1 Tax=Plastoroseomonas hellenica TaxID=2687306 RepID=UPI001BA55268|nr:hypothetical protein [Plastoroseomonas hellenica]MBR0641339.1 hypothetical protein [Plastoroseomonas hellenica]
MQSRIAVCAASFVLFSVAARAQDPACQHLRSTLGIYETADPRERILEIYDGNAAQVRNLVMGFGNPPAPDDSLYGMVVGVRSVECPAGQSSFRTDVARFVLGQGGQVRRLPGLQLPQDARLVAVNGPESTSAWRIVPGFMSGRANVAMAYFVQQGAANEALLGFVNNDPQSAVTCDRFSERIQCQFVVSINGNITQ